MLLNKFILFLRKITLLWAFSIVVLFNASPLAVCQPTNVEQATIDLILVSPIYTESISSYASDANKLFEAFSKPALKSLSLMLGTGWFNSAKTHGNFPKFSVYIGSSIANTPAKDKSFYFNASEYEFLQLKSENGVDGEGESRDIYTVFGDQSFGEADFEAKPKTYSLVNLIHPDQPSILPKGASINYLPSVYLQAQVGVAYGTDILVRFAPAFTLTSNDLVINNGFTYGAGLIHDVSQWLFNDQEKAPHIAVQAAYVVYDVDITNKKLDFPSNINNTNALVAASELISVDDFRASLSPQKTKMDFTAMNINIIGSVQLSFFSPFIAIGYSSASVESRVTGDYPIVLLDEINEVFTNKSLIGSVKDPIKQNKQSYGNVMLTAGCKLKLGIFLVHASYHLNDYSIYELGIGVNI